MKSNELNRKCRYFLFDLNDCDIKLSYFRYFSVQMYIKYFIFITKGYYF